MHTDIITNDLATIVKDIAAHKVVAFPTGTVYGLAANVLSPQALGVLRIVKNRPKEKTFTVFLDPAHLDKFFHVSDQEKNFISKAKDQPLTILLRPKEALRHIAQDGLVGLRIIDHPLMKSLSEVVTYPLTATSANLAGTDPCLSPSCIQANLPSVSRILGDEDLQPAEASTIIHLQDRDIQIIRQGSLSKENLTSLL